MSSAALAVRLLVLALAVYLVVEGIPALQRWQRARERPPLKMPPEFEWVDKSKGLRILHFYASPGAVYRGEEISLCYGVAQASAARIESNPGGALPGVWPSFNRCVIVQPPRDTRYTLVAEDAAGSRRELTLEVTVLANPRPRGNSPPLSQRRPEAGQ
jgi:hypothetical protein